jgi:hypothetical protein
MCAWKLWPFVGVAAVVVNRHRQEVVLDVWPLELFAGADKTARFELVAGADARAVEQPLGADCRLVVPFSASGIQRNRLGARVLQVHLEMVLQVLADARQVVNHLDVEPLEQFAGPTPERCST